MSALSPARATVIVSLLVCACTAEEDEQTLAGSPLTCPEQFPPSAVGGLPQWVVLVAPFAVRGGAPETFGAQAATEVARILRGYRDELVAPLLRTRQASLRVECVNDVVRDGTTAQALLMARSADLLVWGEVYANPSAEVHIDVDIRLGSLHAREGARIDLGNWQPPPRFAVRVDLTPATPTEHPRRLVASVDHFGELHHARSELFEDSVMWPLGARMARSGRGDVAGPLVTNMVRRRPHICEDGHLPGESIAQILFMAGQYAMTRGCLARADRTARSLDPEIGRQLDLVESALGALDRRWSAEARSAVAPDPDLRAAGILATAQGDHTAAIARFSAALRDLEKPRAPANPLAALVRRDLAHALRRAALPDGAASALRLLRESYESLRDALGSSHPYTLIVAGELADLDALTSARERGAPGDLPQSLADPRLLPWPVF